MAIKRPTREQLSDIAAGFGFHVDSRQLAEYDDALQANFDAYDVIDALPTICPPSRIRARPATARKATRTVTAHGRARARSTAPPTVSCAAGRWPSKTTSASPVCRCATAQARSRATCPISMRPSSRGCSTPARRSPARRPASTTAFPAARTRARRGRCTIRARQDTRPAARRPVCAGRERRGRHGARQRPGGSVRIPSAYCGIYG